MADSSSALTPTFLPWLISNWIMIQQLRERDLRRAKAAEQDAKNRADAEKKDGKDERMEELLRKVRGNPQREWHDSNNISCDWLPRSSRW